MHIDEFPPEFINNDAFSIYFFGGGQFMSINEVGSRGQRV